MMKNFLERGRKIIVEPQSTVLSGAFVIMGLVIASQFLALIRQRVLLSFFTQEQYAIFLAAFRLPDLVFEVLALGAFSSAFIPVFTKVLKHDEKAAWEIAGRVVNIGVIIFLPISVLFILFSGSLYNLIAPGFSDTQTQQIASIARILFFAQGIFIVSYVINGVLESSRRFFVTALAPLVYNVGIILTTIILVPSMGLMAPTIGVVIGALGHLFIQVPLAWKLGFRLSKHIKPNENVKLVGKLAAPRIIELSTLQILKTVELAFASLMSVASYGFLSLASSLQAVPISLFGISIAKAALPSLTRASDDEKAFRQIFLSSLYQMMFFVIPITTLLMVLRIPIVRLAYGTGMFDWDATVTTGLVLSAFALGIPIQASLALVSRAFYALHDTKTPVTFAIFDITLTIFIEILCVFVFHLPIWSLALANSLSGFVQISLLYFFLSKKLHDGKLLSITPILKSIIGGITSGLVMFFILKTFDRAAWIKRLSFINSIDALKNLTFEHFVLDTRYTVNLIILSAITAAIGIVVYIIVLWLLKSNELSTVISIIQTRTLKKIEKEEEPITSIDSD